MPTPAERKALAFLATVAVLGATVRAVRAARESSDSSVAVEQPALDRQIHAADSAARGDRRRRGQGTARSSSRRRQRATIATPETSSAVVAPPRERLDLDTATVAQIEGLPGIGPVLARRIVADRDRRGPFGQLDSLARVKGVGPAVMRRLDSVVTFSGTLRLTTVTAAPPESSSTVPAPRRARKHRTAR